jgi:hypothetical protein
MAAGRVRVSEHAPILAQRDDLGEIFLGLATGSHS